MDIRTWITIIILWGILVYTIIPKLSTSLEVEHRKVLKRINKAMSRIHNSSQKNMETLNFIEKYINKMYKIFEKHKKPSNETFANKLTCLLEDVANILYDQYHIFNIDIQLSSDYVQFRNQVSKNTEGMWNYFNSELNKVPKRPGIINDMRKKIRKILQLGAECKRSIIANIDRMRSVDWYELWRQKESENLSNLVERRLSFMQNPADCKNAKKLLCETSVFGFGSQLHHFIYCLIVAYATKRTMVLNSRNWVFHNLGWEDLFQPISETCTEYNIKEAEKWPGTIDTKLLLLPEITVVSPKPSFIPLALPEDLVPHIMKFHGNPNVWWISQFLKYLFKPKTEIQKILEMKKEKLGWKKPIVGVHIRRTDKVGWEAVYHSVEEYMAYVEDYYLTLEMHETTIERRVFLATDDLNVIKEAGRKYPQYTILGDINIAKMANSSTRYSVSALNGIISDIIMLSLSDYLVCTFSSNLCRAAYEMMQNYYSDASDRCKSLDKIFYFEGQNKYYREAMLSHKSRNKNEIVIKSGDLLEVYGSNWNGFLDGKNMRTRKSGMFPLFKLRNEIIRVKLPTYPNAVSMYN